MPEIPMLNDLYEGRGVNPDTNQTFAVAIDFDPARCLVEDEAKQEHQGQQSELTLRIITESSQLSSSLGVSAAAAVTSRMASVSAEAKFCSERTLNSFYTYALAKVTVQNPTKMIRYPRLKPEAYDLLKNYQGDGSAWDEFATLYGTHYVEGYITGGSYYALLEIQTKGGEEKTEVAAKLSGNYKGFGMKVGATAEATSSMQQATQNYSTNVYICQSGGLGDILETDLEGMIEQAKKFTELVKTNPVPIKAIVNSYRNSVGNIPQGIGKLSPKLLKQKDILEDLGKYYLKLRDYKSDLEFILANFDSLPDFANKNDQEKSEERQKFKKSLEDTCTEIDLVVRQATNCADDCDVCETYTKKDDLFLTLPGSRFESLDSGEGSPVRSRSAVPIGSVLPYGGDLTNSELVKELDSRGWLPCDGKSYKISDYPELHKAIGLAFGGNSETFNVPDLRGRFMRGVAGESGQDPDRNSRGASAQGGNAGNKVGSIQQDLIKKHRHGVPVSGPTGSGPDSVGSDRKEKTTGAYSSLEQDDGGQETRPKNIYVYYIIKSK